jgi:ribonuclease Z
MSKLIILGSSNAIPDAAHENTHMALVKGEQFILIDCPGTPTVRLQQAGLDVHHLTDLILTHFHPDHVSGVPSLLMVSWLMGRQAPLNIYGLAHTLERIEALMDAYEWSTWPNFFPVRFIHLPEQEMSPVLERFGMRILASPVHHLIPTIGLRVDFLDRAISLAYSCDTEPCEEVIRLAEGADVLIHEAAGVTIGHASAAQAGEIARKAEVGRLYLIHYPTGDFDALSLVKEAQANYPGPVDLAVDFMELRF